MLCSVLALRCGRREANILGKHMVWFFLSSLLNSSLRRRRDFILRMATSSKVNAKRTREKVAIDYEKEEEDKDQSKKIRKVRRDWRELGGFC